MAGSSRSTPWMGSVTPKKRKAVEALLAALDGYRTEHDRYSKERWVTGTGICSCWCCDEARSAISQFRALTEKGGEVKA